MLKRALWLFGIAVVAVILIPIVVGTILPASGHTQDVVGLPAPPPKVEATVSSDTQVFVAWKPSPTKNVSAYKVYVNGNVSKTVRADGTLTYLASGLTPATEYGFQVTAISSKGESSREPADPLKVPTQAAPAVGLATDVSEHIKGLLAHAQAVGLKPGPESQGGVDCIIGCVFFSGLSGTTPQERALDFESKLVLSPSTSAYVANYVSTITGTPRATDPDAMKQHMLDLQTFFSWSMNAPVSNGVIPKGTTVQNSMRAKDGSIVTFPQVLAKDREVLVYTGQGGTLTVFVTCGNGVSANAIPGVTHVATPPVPPREFIPPSKPPTTTPPGSSPTTTPSNTTSTTRSTPPTTTHTAKGVQPTTVTAVGGGGPAAGCNPAVTNCNPEPYVPPGSRGGNGSGGQTLPTQVLSTTPTTATPPTTTPSGGGGTGTSPPPPG